MTPKISVIIPVYNAEKYLKECLDSVLNQSFKDFEVLIINDGSKDNSRAICDEYAAKDTRIKVFHKENGGVSSARNLGIDNALGEWICFVDSDDYVEKEYVSSLLADASDEISLVVHGLIKFGSGTDKELNLGNDIVSANNHQILFQIKRIQNFGYPFSKLFKREIIVAHQILFPEDYSIAEDLSFLLQYIAKAEIIKFETKHHYCYRQVEGSQSNRLRKPEMYFNRYFDIKRIFEENYKTVYEEIYTFNIHFPALHHTFGSMLFQSILSLYFFNLTKTERITYLKKVDAQDRKLIGIYKEHFKNPVFKWSFKLIEKQQLIKADTSLFIFFKIRKQILRILGKPLHYKFKK